jgi:hypothetical protein
MVNFGHLFDGIFQLKFLLLKQRYIRQIVNIGRYWLFFTNTGSFNFINFKSRSLIVLISID